MTAMEKGMRELRARELAKASGRATVVTGLTSDNTQSVRENSQPNSTK